MENKKAVSPLMLAIVVIIIGIVTLLFALVFFGVIGEKATSEFFGLFETTKQTCHEKCVIGGYETGACISNTEECENQVTGISDCIEGEICCCT